MTIPLTYQDIFVPGGFPRHTYNPRGELQLERKVAESRQNLCKLVTVTGQTKSGKTVLVRKILPREDSVWVDGGIVSSEEDFWHVVIDQLELFQSATEESSKATSSGFGGKASAGANFIVAKGEGEVSAKIEKGRGKRSGATRTLSSRVVALNGLSEARIPLVIDDFHYIPRGLQGSLVRALKPLIFDGLPAVIIAIPHRRYDALKVEREMTGRIYPVEIPIWSEAELRFIPKTGFDLLNITPGEAMVSRLAAEAIGSPHLMQEFCRGICRALAITQEETQTDLTLANEKLDGIFRDVAETIGRPIFEKLARGPRQRTDRIQREVKDGRKVDIYELVLLALAQMRPALVSIEYEDLRSAIREVSASQVPQLQEIARVLRHMSTIAATDQSSTPVIEYDEEERKLHITDPFFAFYLRWGSLVG